MVAEDYFDYDGEGRDRSELVLLEHWQDAAWEALLSHTSRHHVAAGEHLLREGQVDKHLYFVASGAFDVVAGRRRRRLTTVGPGGILGELPFFDGEPASADVLATGDSVVLGLTRDGFDAFAGHHPDLGRDLLFGLGRVLSQRVRRLTVLAVR